MTDATPQQQLRAMIGDYWRPHVIACAARLGLADAMGSQSLTAEALAALLKADGEALHRLLRALAAIGLVSDEGQGRFALTPMGDCLRADSPASLRGMALHVATQLSPAFAQLESCVRTGSPPPGIRHGTDGFSDLNDDPGAAAIFNQAMVDNSRRFAAEAAQAFDFSVFRSVADVGGGYGAVLAGLLAAVPGLTGTVLDLPHAEAGALALFEREGVADRARFRAASFFEPLPEAADCYVLKYILHDWPDAEAEAITRQVANAARAAGGTVMVIEKLMPEQVTADPDHAIATYGDLTMMLWNGKERTRAEFSALFERAGLTLTGLHPLSDNHFLIEARPVG